MDTRRLAAEYRLSHWAQIIRDHRESGLSIKDYCEAADIPLNSYYYWQRKLRESACVELRSAEREVSIKSEQPLASSGWVVYNPGKTENIDSSVLVEIGSCRLTATTDTDMVLLSKVCRVLVGLC